jgi:microcystin-dependent protein
MSYQIRFTDQINNQPLKVDDNTTNQVTDLNFPGRNTTGYGQAIGENFLHLLENFANTVEPTNPVKGQLWYNTNSTSKQLNVYDGTQWVAAGGLKKSSGIQPAVVSSLPGDLWVNTDTQQLFLFSGSGWILVGPRFSAGARTGAEPETLVDKTNVDRIVVSNFVNGTRVAIISSVTFQPKTTIPGFPTIYAGTTLNSSFNGYYGTAEKASKLIVSGYLSTGLEADNFLRSDIVTNNYKGINVKNNAGIQIGEDGQMELGIDNGVGKIYQKTSGSSIDVRVNNNGSERIVIRVDSQERVGINNIAPQEALDVAGNIRIKLTEESPESTGNLVVLGTSNSTSLANGALTVVGGVGIGKNLNVGGTLKVDGVVTVSSSIIPATNNGASLGIDGTQFSEIRANKIYAATEFNGTLTGNVKGSVDGSATNLASATIFEMTGDISSNEIEFNGKTGVDPVTIGNITNVTGKIITFSFAAAQTVPPFPKGTRVVVDFVAPSTYNAQYTVLTGTTTEITVAGVENRAMANTGGTISPDGVIGNRKRFVTTLADTFIESKPVIDKLSNLGEGDKILVSQTGLGLKSITKSLFFSAMPQMPVGMIVPYAGLTAPTGWLLCDGSEVLKTKYQALATVIEGLYGNNVRYNVTTNPLGAKGQDTFKLPDLRGRFPLGADNMFNGQKVPAFGSSTLIDTITTPAGRVTDPAATIDYTSPPDVRVGTGDPDPLDRTKSREFAYLDVDNLPDHEHDMKGANNGIYGAYANSPWDAGLDNSQKVPGLGGTADAGRLLATSGGIKTTPENAPLSQPINIMNPFLALNYIIWTGKLTD